MTTISPRWPVFGLIGLLLVAVLGWADQTFRWVEPVFTFVAHQFYEVPMLAAIRRESQLELVRMHLVVLTCLISLGLICSPILDRQGRWFWSIFCAAYTIRALCWIIGGDLPLVPGDSCHYLEVATSIYRGEGPLKHYVESFFIDYPEIRRDQGVLDDWATPLWAYMLAFAYKITGVVPGVKLEATVAVAKGLSFFCNLLAIPALHGFARRRFNPEVALGAITLLAILPVHAIYAGFALRESVVALTTILAIWSLSEAWEGSTAWHFGCAAIGGLFAGLAILARNTSLALIGTAGLFALVRHGRKAPGPLILWGIVMLLVIAPWAWVTKVRYGEPFYTYTKFFQYNFSWTIHHYMKGNTKPGEFYTVANAPEILRVKIKALGIILVYCTMIPGVVLILAGLRRLFDRRTETRSREMDLLIACLFIAFSLATLANIADVTQVMQLGRYYLPLFVLLLPSAAAGIHSAWREWALPKRAIVPLSFTLIVSLWADPTWAYDAGWYAKPYQTHLPALVGAADWIKKHPESVDSRAHVMTWFPWELRVASDRTTILMPRSYFRPHIERAIKQYNVTHVLWGSFELPEHAEPIELAKSLEQLRLGLGLSDAREIYRSPAGSLYPVRLYRLTAGGTSP